MTTVRVLVMGATGYIAGQLLPAFQERYHLRLIDLRHENRDGVSKNARTFWSITNARKVIGCQPGDDSEVRFAADIARLLR